jgi:hypothetical protein
MRTQSDKNDGSSDRYNQTRSDDSNDNKKAQSPSVNKIETKRQPNVNAYPNNRELGQPWKEVEDVMSELSEQEGGDYNPIKLHTIIKEITREKKRVIESRCKERNIKVKPGRKMINSKAFINRSRAKITKGKLELEILSKDQPEGKESGKITKLRNQVSA